MKSFNAITGVHSASNIEWMWETNYIDLSWIEHLKECKSKYHDNCGPQEQGTSLFGGWGRKKGRYYPKCGGEYAAIYNPDYNTVQVIRSKFLIQCNFCSPCYPNQGDVDTPGNVWAYCLPPDLMGEGWLKENGHRIYEYIKTRRSHYWRKWQKAAV